MTLAKLLALALTAIVVIPSGAHLFELPGKIDLGRDAYFTVQGIYAGWAYFAVPIIGAIVANGVLAAMLRKRAPGPARWAALSSLLIVASLVVFFTSQPIRKPSTGPCRPTTGKSSGDTGSMVTRPPR